MLSKVFDSEFSGFATKKRKKEGHFWSYFFKCNFSFTLIKFGVEAKISAMKITKS